MTQQQQIWGLIPVGLLLTGAYLIHRLAWGLPGLWAVVLFSLAWATGWLTFLLPAIRTSPVRRRLYWLGGLICLGVLFCEYAPAPPALTAAAWNTPVAMAGKWSVRPHCLFLLSLCCLCFISVDPSQPLDRRLPIRRPWLVWVGSHLLSLGLLGLLIGLFYQIDLGLPTVQDILQGRCHPILPFLWLLDALIFFVLAYRIHRYAQRTPVDLHQRLAAMLISVLLIAPLGFMLHIPLLAWACVGLVFLLVFDLFLETPISSMTWVLVWCSFFAGLGAYLTYLTLAEQSQTGYLSEVVAASSWPTFLSVFSFFFLSFLMSFLLLVGWRQLGGPVPENLSFPGFGSPSLRDRIQLATISLVLIAYFILALITVKIISQEPELGVGGMAGGTGLYALLDRLLTAYIFFLVIAAVLGIYISNTLTDPLVQLSERLQQLKLEANEPLDWEAPDEIGQLVAAYNRMIKKLAISTQAMRQSEREFAWREMAKQVAHEIKNPLTPMKLSLQYLQQTQRHRPDRLPQLMESVAVTLIEQIDSLSRIASEFARFGQLPQTDVRTFDLIPLVENTVRLFSEGKAHPMIDWQLSLPAGPVEVRADREQLGRILGNLIKNARQAIPAACLGRIEIDLVKKDQTVQLRVTDNGSGIPEKIRQKIFAPNFTTKSTGMGMGLAISKLTMEQMGGDIWFDTCEGAGTTFYLGIPAV